METVEKHRNIKLSQQKEEKIIQHQNEIIKYIFSIENLLAIEMKKTEILLNKHVHLGLLILELSNL